MGGRKGKAVQRQEGPERLASGEQESTSASADGVPSRDHRQGRGKARGATPILETAMAGSQGTSGAHKKPTAERNGGCRGPVAAPPSETQGKQGSVQRGKRGPKKSHEPGDRRARRLEEESLPRGEGTTGERGRHRRGRKRRGPSARRGLDRDTSGGDPDREAREAQGSGSHRGGAPEVRPQSGQTDTGSGGTQTESESALDPGELLSSDGLSSDEPRAKPRSQEGSFGTEPQGATEDSGTDKDSSPEQAEPGRDPQAALASGTWDTEAEEAELGRKATTSSPLEGSRACVPQSSRNSHGARPARDTNDKGAQREAVPQAAEPGGTEVSTARTGHRQVGKVVGKVQAAAGESEAGAGEDGPGDPAPLAALVALHRICARPPPGPVSQDAGPRRAGLKERFLRVAQALSLLRWLWRRLWLREDRGQGAEPQTGVGQRAEPRAGEGQRAEPPAGEGQGAEPHADERRGRGPGLRRRLALRLAGVARLGGRLRAPPGGSPSSPQASKSPGRDEPSEEEDPTRDPKFAVVFPRILRAGRSSSSRSLEEAPTGEGLIWPCARASRDSERLRASGEGMAGPRRGSLLGPTPPDESPLNESGSSSEAEPETLEAEVPVHWTQGSDAREDPELDTHALLPRLTLERSPDACGSQRERWEPEDEAEAALERDLELSLGPGLEALSYPGTEGSSPVGVLEDTEDLARLR